MVDVEPVRFPQTSLIGPCGEHRPSDTRDRHYIVEARDLMYLRSLPELQGDTFRPDF